MGYSPGSIVRVTLHDFMSFKYGNLLCNSKLNIIVGSNGSGKSSLACAIVLGLAGKAKYLERASNLNEFIRRGCDEGRIEIELYHPDGNITIQRIITINNKSIWFINGSSVSLKKVEEKMKELSIQVDNLCQFLPQDKVHDFAKMSKQELLHNTQNSVGSPFLIETFQKLIEEKKVDVNSEAQLKELENRLVGVTEKHDRLAKAYERVKEKQKMSNEIHMLQKKQAWVKYENKKKEYNEEERARREREKRLKEIRQSAKPFEVEINQINNLIKKAEEEVARLKIEENQNHGLFKNVIHSAKQWHSKIDFYKEEYEEMILERNRKDSEIKELERKISEVESHLDPEREKMLAQQVNEINKKIEEVTNECNRLTETEYKSRQQVQMNEAEVACIQNKIKEASDVEMKKLQLLKNRNQSAYEIKQLVQQNPQFFVGKVYGPVFMELKLENIGYARYVEGVISGRDMIAFICEEAEDVTKLVRLCKQKGLPVNAFAAPKNVGSGSVKEIFKPKIPIEHLRKYSFKYYLLDILDGPEPVLCYLCKQYRIHEIPVGLAHVSECLNSIPREIWKFFSDKHQFTVTFSRYTNERSTRSSYVSERIHLLIYSVTKPDETLLLKLQQQDAALKVSLQHLTLLNNQKAKKEQEKNSYFEQKKKLLGIDEQIKFFKVKKEGYVRELRMVRSKDIDLNEEEQKKNLKIREAVLKSSNDLKKSAEYLKSYQKFVEKRKLRSLDLEIFNRKLTSKERNFCDIKRKIDSAEMELDIIQKACLQLKEDVRLLRLAAAKLTDNLYDTDLTFTRIYGKAFKYLPNNIEELDARINEIKARADCLMGTDEQVEEEYKMVQRTLQNLKEVITTKKADWTHKSNKVKKLKDQWLPEINKLVEKINDKFSSFFQQMNCVGEVSLWHGENDDDFSSYGLAIRVKFRDCDSLQELDRYSQSGGERSVTIAVYMLSLQELTHVPFRCVDEINQGMDDKNEMRIYRLLMETISNLNVSQYFLITPKLLKGIKFSEHVVVHTIYCGDNCVPNEQSEYFLDFFKRISNCSKAVKRRRNSISDSESDT